MLIAYITVYRSYRLPYGIQCTLYSTVYNLHCTAKGPYHCILVSFACKMVQNCESIKLITTRTPFYFVQSIKGNFK